MLKLTPQVRGKKDGSQRVEWLKKLRQAMGLSIVVCNVKPERGSVWVQSPNIII